jgi:hypothetical protein
MHRLRVRFPPPAANRDGRRVHSRAAQALAAKVERGSLEDGFTLRDVRRNQWRNLTTDEAIQAALEWLEDEDWLSREATGGTGPGSGRPTVRYRIHPAIEGKRRGRDA